MAGLPGGLAAGCAKRLLGKPRSTEAWASDSLVRAREAAAAAAALTKKDTMKSTTQVQLTASTPAQVGGRSTMFFHKHIMQSVLKVGRPTLVNAGAVVAALIAAIHYATACRGSSSTAAYMLPLRAAPPVRYCDRLEPGWSQCAAPLAADVADAANAIHQKKPTADRIGPQKLMPTRPSAVAHCRVKVSERRQGVSQNGDGSKCMAHRQDQQTLWPAFKHPVLASACSQEQDAPRTCMATSSSDSRMDAVADT